MASHVVSTGLNSALSFRLSRAIASQSPASRKGKSPDGRHLAGASMQRVSDAPTRRKRTSQVGHGPLYVWPAIQTRSRKPRNALLKFRFGFQSRYKPHLPEPWPHEQDVRSMPDPTTAVLAEGGV